jgi:hypothetical protein
MEADERDDGGRRRRILVYTARLSVVAAILGAVGGWYADRFTGAVVGAVLMGLVFAPCIGLLALGIGRLGRVED